MPKTDADPILNYHETFLGNDASEQSPPEVEVVASPIEVNNLTHPIPPEPVGELMQIPDKSQNLDPIMARLNEYAVRMGDGSQISNTDGGMEQYKLWKLIKDLLAIEDGQEAFNARWNMLLDFASLNRATVFSETKLYRFPESWYGTATEFNAFRRIMYTITNTCDIATRTYNLQYIRLEIVLSEEFTEDEKNKIITFYS